MGFFNLFARPSPEKLEKKGDALLQAEQRGLAKLEYEHALDQLEQKGDTDPELLQRISEKLTTVKEGLAKEHQQNASDLIAGGFREEARDLLRLALELSIDPDFQQAVQQQMNEMENRPLEDMEMDTNIMDPAPLSEGEPDVPRSQERASDEEIFAALCGTLPEVVGDAYLDYGENFKTGYMALNRGDFDTAVRFLIRAMDDHPEPDSYIPLELAAAYANLGRTAEAQQLLKRLLAYHPDALPAYQLLCDIHWEQKDFQQVDVLLASVPEDFADSLAIILLKGETLFRSGGVEAARKYYQDAMDRYGWQEDIARALARAHEALGDASRARAIYKEMMDTCTSCHARVDPIVKHKYAELSFQEGVHNSEILELYLSLAREHPDNAAVYFDRISRIYANLGNIQEAERFRGFSERAIAEQSRRS